MAFDWLIQTKYFVVFRQNSNFWAQVSQDSRSCDEVYLLSDRRLILPWHHFLLLDNENNQEKNLSKNSNTIENIVENGEQML